MPKLNLSIEELNNILNDYNNGMSMHDISEKYHHSHKSLRRYFLEHNIPIRNKKEALLVSEKKKKADANRRIYSVNDCFFSEQNSDMAYLLGFLMADGNVSKKDNRIQIVLSNIDKDFLIKVQEKIGGSPVVEYLYNGRLTIRWQCFSAKIKQDLIKYGVIPNKTGFAKIPNKLDKRFYPDFIRGYFDGDGSIYEDNAVGLSFVSHNMEILQDILDALEELGVPPVTIHEYNSRKGNYYIRYRTKSALKIYEIFYRDKNCFKLQRKYDKFTEIVQKKKDSTRLRT